MNVRIQHRNSLAVRAIITAIVMGALVVAGGSGSTIVMSLSSRVGAAAGPGTQDVEPRVNVSRLEASIMWGASLIWGADPLWEIRRPIEPENLGHSAWLAAGNSC